MTFTDACDVSASAGPDNMYGRPILECDNIRLLDRSCIHINGVANYFRYKLSETSISILQVIISSSHCLLFEVIELSSSAPKIPVGSVIIYDSGTFCQFQPDPTGNIHIINLSYVPRGYIPGFLYGFFRFYARILRYKANSPSLLHASRTTLIRTSFARPDKVFYALLYSLVNLTLSFRCCA